MLTKSLKIFSWGLVATLGLILFFLPVSLGWQNRLLFILIGVLIHGIAVSKHIRRSIFILIGFILLVWLLLQTELLQNFIVGKVTDRLSNDLHTEVKIKLVSFSFFDKMDLNGVLVRDLKKDTLLFAGTVKLRITDWFFLKDRTDLKYVGLEDAVINMHRKDSVWNYQFIANYFSSSNKPTDSTSTAKHATEPKKIAINIQKIDLKKVTFINNDEWKGQKMTVKVGSMLLDAEKTDLSNPEFIINSIELDKPSFTMEDFDGLRPAPPPYIFDSGMYFNAGDIAVKIASLKITDGVFTSLKRGDVPEKGRFDGAYIKVSKISGSFKQLSFIKDTIKASVDLTGVERSGLELKKLKADFSLTPQTMEFANLDMRTGKSRLGNYYAMHFKDFNEDMPYFVEKIILDAHIKNTEIHSDDIAFFAPELRDWHQKASMSGKFHGTIENFNVEDLFIRTSANTYASGDLFMKGLPDIDKTVIKLSNANVQTNNKEIAFIYNDIKTITNPDLAALGNIHFLGNFSGTINNLTAQGNVSSRLGGLYTDINLVLPKKGDPSYKGSIQSKDFNLGKFIDVKSLGRVSFTGKIQGKSFSLERAKTTIDGTFNSLEFNGYTYSNLIFNGAVEKKKFNGDFKANDPNFDFTSSIQVDFTGAQPQFNILGDLAVANFKKLNFTKDNYQLTGLFDLNFVGRNIDEFLGSAKVFNAYLLKDSTQLDFDSLTVTASYDSINKKVLSIKSNQFEAFVAGQYNILDLPNSFQTFLSRYYPAYINIPKIPAKNQEFVVSLKTKDFTKYAFVINPKLTGLDNIELHGGVNTNRQDSGFYLSAKIPNVRYDKYQLENAQINAFGSIDSLVIVGDIGRVYVGDSLFFPNSHLNIRSSNDFSTVHLTTSANETLNDADLNADVHTLEDGVRINFRPSSFVLNANRWQLDKEGELVIRKNFASAKNVKFSQGFQEITVETEEEDGGNSSNLVVNLKRVNLGDFVPLFTKKPRIEGLANGNVYLRDFYNKFNAEAKITAEQFRLDDDSVGIVQLTAGYSKETGKINYDVKSYNENYNFIASGFYNLKDSVNLPLSTRFHSNGTKIGLLNQFLGDLFEDIDGIAQGDLTIAGNPSQPTLIGKIKLKNAALTVKFTQVRYNVDNADFVFTTDGIDFGKFTIRDKFNNTGTVRGILYENGFKNMKFDFDMATDNLLLIDTKAKDNEQFYGNAIGRANLSFKGPEENMRMNILGEVTDTTHMSIVTSGSKESADAAFIVFKKYGTELTANKKNSDNKLTIDLDLTTNNKAQIDVILDELTGDVISATGNGRIKINVPPNGNMTMNGRYNIESGRYNFNFQSFLRKPFDLKNDAGNYIEWTGDPYKAEMHIDAVYTAKNVTFNDLLSNTGYNLGGTVAGYRGEVYVIASLTGKLANPQIKFGFDFPENSPIKNDNTLKLFLDKVQSDDNEMLKQVTWLIVFGSFAPYGEIGSGGGNVARTAGINTLSQKITGELNKLVSNLLAKITGDKSLQFDVNTSTYSSAVLYGTSSSNNRLDRQTINLKVSQTLLNNKVIITFGTGLDFNISGSAVQSGNFQWLPDISIQFILSRDRKLRAIIFNKSSLDVSNGAIGRRIRQGVSLSYSFDFPNDKPPILADSALKNSVKIPNEIDSTRQ